MNNNELEYTLALKYLQLTKDKTYNLRQA